MSFKKYKEWILKDPRSEKLDFNPDGRNHYVYRVSKEEHYYGSKSELIGVLGESIGIKYFTSSNYLEESFKANPKDYKVKIIRTFDNPADKILFESYLHQKFDVKSHDSFINRSNQTPFGFDTTGRKCTDEEALQNRQQSIDYWHDPKLGEERRRQNGERNKKYWDKGENRLSRSIKAKDYWNDEEFGYQRREENSQKNKDYWNDEELGEERRLERSLKITGINSKMAKPVIQFDLKTGKIIKEWDYAKQASDILNVSKDGISQCCLGNQKSAGGFGWKR